MKLYEQISRWRFITLSAISFASFIVCWTLLSQTVESAAIFLPSPLVVVTNLLALFRDEAFANDILASIYRVTAGFLLAVVVAFPLGILAGTIRTIDAIVQPFNDFVRYMPVAAFIPLTILWIGIEDTQKVAIIFLGTVFQLIPMIADTVQRVPKQLIELGYTMGLSPAQVILRVIIPWCMPIIYDHCRIALGWAWSYLVVAELVAARSGIGHVIIQSQRFIQTGNVIGGILIIGLIGLLFDQMFKLPKRRIFKWL